MPLAHVRISKIRWDSAGAVRNRVNEAAVARYIEISPENLPPVTLYHDLDDDGEDRYWLAEGLHRLAAAWTKEHENVWAEVRPGGRRDALLHACGANTRHGVPRSNADKLHVVSRLLTDPIWSEQSNVWIAEQCKVSHTYVGRVRKRIGKAENYRRGRDGKLRKLPALGDAKTPAGEEGTRGEGREASKTAEQPASSSRDVALAELAKSKAELDVAIQATEEAASLDTKLPTAKVLKALRAARREIVLWEKDLLDRPPEPPAPDPLDLSPEGRTRAQLYAINRMDSTELLGLMQKTMSHDRARLEGKGRETRDEARVGRERDAQPATKQQRQVVRGRDNQPATNQAGRALRVDFGPPTSSLPPGISGLFQPATKQEGREPRDERRVGRLDEQPATKQAPAQPATNHASRVGLMDLAPDISNLRSEISDPPFTPPETGSGPPRSPCRPAPAQRAPRRGCSCSST